MDEQIGELTRQSDELLRRIASTGYEELKSQLKSLNELLEQLEKRSQVAADRNRLKALGGRGHHLQPDPFGIWRNLKTAPLTWRHWND